MYSPFIFKLFGSFDIHEVLKILDAMFLLYSMYTIAPSLLSDFPLKACIALLVVVHVSC